MYAHLPQLQPAGVDQNSYPIRKGRFQASKLSLFQESLKYFSFLISVSKNNFYFNPDTPQKRVDYEPGGCKFVGSRLPPAIKAHTEPAQRRRPER
jgi:hypothetical protein